MPAPEGTSCASRSHWETLFVPKASLGKGWWQWQVPPPAKANSSAMKIKQFVALTHSHGLILTFRVLIFAILPQQGVGIQSFTGILVNKTSPRALHQHPAHPGDGWEA